GDMILFVQKGYCRRGREAIRHLHRVAAGLDSQILGDYEIVSQLKKAFRTAVSHHLAGGVLQRMVNSALESSKLIRTETRLSNGSVSVSFLAVKYVSTLETFSHSPVFLVFGAGKIGRNLCRNLLEFFPDSNITVINRSLEKAEALALDLSIHCASVSQIRAQIARANVIFLATSAPSPILLKEDISANERKLIIDLSIPSNAENGVGDLSHINLISVDQISNALDENLKLRAAEVPVALQILETHLDKFFQWLELRKQIPHLEILRRKLHELSGIRNIQFNRVLQLPSANNPETQIQKAVSQTARKMRYRFDTGCLLIEALDHYSMALYP
ncbi:MAG: NAD(P)-binding domain-containing protein, partial [Bacteroidota bacterium]|nr:NAD(P)-binding domain-containing protein [Bacteroidota bacterium]